MKKIIDNIFYRNNIINFGICDFGLVEKNLIKCRNLNFIPDNPKSIMTAVFPYFMPIKSKNISRYAIPKDYHITVISMLDKVCSGLKDAFPNYKFRAFSDNSPIPEVWAAALANLGCIGDNGLLITKKFGSWVFIGEIVTDMDIPSCAVVPGQCLHCGLCARACPSGAVGEKKIKKDICLSAVTQKKGELTEHERNLILSGNSVWGCDICQDCCPLNQNISETYLDAFRTNLYPVIGMNNYKTLKNRAFGWRPKYVIERNLNILKQKKYLC